MSKVILFVDGDNITESYTHLIFQAARNFGEVYEAHCFGDFVEKKMKWETAYSQYKVQLHYVPGSKKQKGKPDPNTSDIALTVLAMEKLYELPEIDTCIVVANDKDYIPLAKAVREKFHKKAVMFYTEQNDKAVTSYDEAVLLEEDDSAFVPSAADPVFYDPVSCAALHRSIKEQMVKDELLLSNLGPVLKDKGINYNSLGDYLKEMFKLYPYLDKEYVLKLGDKRDRIERKA